MRLKETKVIALANQKGGCGKTITTVTWLASFGHKLSDRTNCQGVLEKKLGTAAHLVRKRGDNQLDVGFSLSIANSSDSHYGCYYFSARTFIR